MPQRRYHVVSSCAIVKVAFRGAGPAWLVGGWRALLESAVAYFQPVVHFVRNSARRSVDRMPKSSRVGALLGGCTNRLDPRSLFEGVACCAGAPLMPIGPWRAGVPVALAWLELGRPCTMHTGGSDRLRVE